eukprot:SM000061S19292  [mRNA]  locus=s61:495768:496578:- [translate_table: standard]
MELRAGVDLSSAATDELQPPGLPSEGTTMSASQAEADDPFGLRLMESDLFGLKELVAKPSRKEDRARRRREEEAAARQQEAAARRLVSERREALLHCVSTAAARYKLPWAQTAIDMLMKHAHDHAARFTAAQRAAILKLYLASKEQQLARKHGGRGLAGKLDVTSFERLQGQYANEKISIRKAVGASGGRTTTSWLG